MLAVQPDHRCSRFPVHHEDCMMAFTPVEVMLKNMQDTTFEMYNNQKLSSVLQCGDGDGTTSSSAFNKCFPSITSVLSLNL